MSYSNRTFCILALQSMQTKQLLLQQVNQTLYQSMIVSEHTKKKYVCKHVHPDGLCKTPAMKLFSSHSFSQVNFGVKHSLLTDISFHFCVKQTFKRKPSNLI